MLSVACSLKLAFSQGQQTWVYFVVCSLKLACSRCQQTWQPLWCSGGSKFVPAQLKGAGARVGAGAGAGGMQVSWLLTLDPIRF